MRNAYVYTYNMQYAYMTKMHSTGSRTDRNGTMVQDANLSAASMFKRYLHASGVSHAGEKLVAFSWRSLEKIAGIFT